MPKTKVHLGNMGEVIVVDEFDEVDVGDEVSHRLCLYPDARLVVRAAEAVLDDQRLHLAIVLV